MPVNRNPFERFLVDRGYLSPARLAEVVRLQVERRQPLVQTVLESGVLDDRALARAISNHFGYRLVDPRSEPADPELLERLPEQAARRLKALPLRRLGPKLVRVAVADPFDPDLQHDLQFALDAALDPVVAPAGELAEALDRAYAAGRELSAFLEQVEREPGDEKPALLDLDLAALERSALSGGIKPYVDLFNQVLSNAHRTRASDLHLEPQREGVLVRYRIDGVLREAMTLPDWVKGGLASRIKAIGGMDVGNRLDPQEGRARAVLDSVETDLRISVLPGQHGETVAIRMIDASILDVDLAGLGFSSDQLRTFNRLLAQPQGMLLLAGPTGSGKSTTLYAAVNRLRRQPMKIVTVEDPVEFAIPGVTQMQVNERRGITFGASVRLLVRQDPDVLVIGEIRDPETARAAFQAALSGHFVLATIHAADTASTLTRLRNLDVPDYLAGATLIGIAAQRLVRRLCVHCRQPVPAGLGNDPAGGFDAGPGCPRCLHTGYRGRIGVFEVLEMGEAIRELVVAGVDEGRIGRAARQAGISRLIDEGLAKVRDGETTQAEVEREIAPPGVARRPVRIPDEAVELVETAEPAEVKHREPLVLIVDDSPEIVEMVAYTLSRAGFRTLGSPDGTAALQEIERHRLNDPVQLVVLDVMMPGLSGLEVAARLRSGIQTAFLPILMLSARGEQQHIREGFRSGADDYLPKPFDPEELVLRIRSLLRRAYGPRS